MYNPAQLTRSGDDMKNASIREQVERCIEELRRGELNPNPPKEGLGDSP